ncbi:MAG: U32 family peptidase [Kiritimatiellaeota bacterium]|nr:U32 family peptidase [Kiritimatiellota bacterium]
MANTIPELMAPAGTLDAGLTAFDAGADAVYVGLPRFNARERGKNCTLEEVGKLITYARRIGRRVYVTLNTLVKETEIDDVAVLVAQLAPLRPHAVIVQDLGILRLVRRHFPQLPIHVSTQAGTHNSAGVALFERLGAERVILERQVTVSELARILERTEVGIEVFVHGALCCSRSGVCLFSSWLGGWSGNRGKCKQPCRRRYYSEGGNGFFFSARDLYSLDVLPRYIELGVTSLKIEGRLRGADYVRSVVSAYRMVLDASAEDRADVLSKARAVLSEAHGRRWSSGFRTSADFSNVVEHRRMGVAGLLCGSTVRTSQHGVTVLVTRPLSVGDRVRFQPLTGEEGPSFTLTQLKVNGRAVQRALPGSECRVPVAAAVPCPARVYRLGRRTSDMGRRTAALPVCRRVVDLHVVLAVKRIAVRVDNLPIPVWETSVETRPARKRAVSAADIESEFRRSGGTDIMAAGVSASAAPGLFLPMAELKRVRRSFWEWVREQTPAELFTAAAHAALGRFRAEFAKSVSGMGPALEPETTVLVGKGKPNPVPLSRTCRVLDDARVSEADEVLVPDLCPEADLPQLRRRIRELVGEGIRRFRVTSFFGLEVLCDETARTPDLVIVASFPLPICNTLALRSLLDLGVRRATAWVELDAPALEALIRRAPEHIELFVFGRIPVLRTRSELPVNGPVRDDRGRGFVVERERTETLLYPEETFRIPERLGFPCFFDLTHASLDDGTPVASFNYEHEWV